jgi:general secretion pathway protein B
VYSDNPAQRLLLINGQVLSQGSLAAPDLTLERIGANTSEFSFRGTRFRMAH